MPRNCPGCGTVNYDDLATTCLTCSSTLPPIEEVEDDLEFSLDDIEKELAGIVEGTSDDAEAIVDGDSDDELFFTEEEKEKAPAEELVFDDMESPYGEPAEEVEETVPEIEAPEEDDSDDELFSTEEAPADELVFDDMESPYGEPAQEIEETVPEIKALEEDDSDDELFFTEEEPAEEVYEEPLVEAPGIDVTEPVESDVPSEVLDEAPEYEDQVLEEETTEISEEYTDVNEEETGIAEESLFGDGEPVTPVQVEDTAEEVSVEETTKKTRVPRKRKDKKADPSSEEEKILDKKTLKLQQKRKAKLAELELEMQSMADVDEEGATSRIFWLLNIVSLFFFVFLAIFVVTEFMLLMFNVSASAPSALFALSPVVGDVIGTPILFVGVLLVGIDAVLHLWDKKFNLMLSFVPTSLMIIGLGVGAYEGAIGDVDIYLLYVLLFALLTFLAIDIIAWMEYPEVLTSPGREGLDTYMGASQRVGEIRSEIEEEYEDILAEEEEKLRIKEEEVHDIKSEIETLNNQLSEEEEKIRLKDEEIASIQSELEVKKDDLMEEEEKLRIKEESLDSVVRAEVERYSQDWVAEEEEKIRIKEEELARTRSDLDIQKSMAEDMRERLRMKEYELNNVRTELESQLRNRLEEEEMLRIKETAARMGEKENKKRTLFPFTAMVGQEKMKRALVLNAIYSGVGGVLIRGQKGTGKSVSVRGLAEVLPNIKVTGCKFNCDPEEEETLCYECRRRLEMEKLETFERPVQVVDLPLNVTEDRLVGSIDIEKILSEGTKSFEPGILAEAHRGILYVDEINLLDDYIVDILLDAASSGQVVIEREGVSVNHPSHFIIVGSMNPEEGELRPQILDRIALQTDVIGIHIIDSRMEIVKRRDDFTKDAQSFRAKFEPEQENLRKKIESARKVLPSVTTPDRMLTLIARLCVDFDVDGHRADIIIERGARSNAAFEERLEVTSEDVVAAAEMALPHRMRTKPYAEERFDTEVLKKWVKKIEAEV